MTSTTDCHLHISKFFSVHWQDQLWVSSGTVFMRRLIQLLVFNFTLSIIFTVCFSFSGYILRLARHCKILTDLAKLPWWFTQHPQFNKHRIHAERVPWIHCIRSAISESVWINTCNNSENDKDRLIPSWPQRALQEWLHYIITCYALYR